MDSGDWQRASEYLALAEETFLKQKEEIWRWLLPMKLWWADFLDRQGRRNETLKYLLEAAEIASQTIESTQTEFVRGQMWRVYDRLFSLLLGQPEKNSAPSGVEDGAQSSDGPGTPARRPARPSATDQADWQPVAEDLRQRLIEPLERSGALSGIRRLGLIPFGFLHALPFAALARVEGGRVTFLVEDYALFYPPSATFLKHASGRVAPADHTMISLGRNESDEAGLPPLGFAVEEAHAVAQIFGGQVRVNASASETELKQLAPHFQFIHLATHAVSEPQMVLLSRLKLQATNEDDGNLTVREILDLGLQAELVTLGACQTGLSFSSSGNELAEVDRIGLIQASRLGPVPRALISASALGPRPSDGLGPVL